MAKQRTASRMAQHALEPPARIMARDRGAQPPRSAGLCAGISLLIMAGLGGLGTLIVIDGLITPGEPTRSASDILASEGTFRLGVAAMYLVVVLDVVVAWALFRYFAPVNHALSQLAGWLRLAYSGVLLVAVSQLAGVPALLRQETSSGVLGEEELAAQAMLKIESYHDIWFAGLLLFGAHLLVIGYLAYRSGYVPRVLGVLLAIAGAGYAFDTFGSVLSPNPLVISTVTFLGEFLLALWLVVPIRRMTLWARRDDIRTDD